MNSQGLELVSLREPTRETATSSTCIDAIYSNFSVQLSQILKTTFSDHYSLQLDMNMSLEMVENSFEFRSLQKLEDPLYCGTLLFFLSHFLSKINEFDTPAEKYLDKIVKTLRESTDRYLPLDN